MLKAGASAATGDTPGAWSSRLRTLLDLRYLAALSAIATYGLIVLGGTVRATDSGLACPDWPRCNGQFIPPLEGSVLIEYSHRLAAASVGVLIVGVAITAWLWHRENRFVLAGATTAIVLLIAQVLVGAVTVNMELPDTVVALHLSIALIILAVLVATAIGAIGPGRREPRGPNVAQGPPAARGAGRLIAVAALATFGLILVGSYVANSGAALVYPDWPLFDGKLVSAGGRLADLHYAHRLMAAFVGVLILAVVVQVWRGERGMMLKAATGLALVLYAIQVPVGASNIWFDLATSARVAHLALASALWAVLAFCVAWGYVERAESEGVAG